jgi:flagellar motor switch protein FliN/FliY
MTYTAHDDDTAAILSTVTSAAAAAAPLLPADAPLVPGTASASGEFDLPADASKAVVARLSGEVSGDVVLVISDAVVEALTNSPVGEMDVAAALRPALEAAAATLGAVTVTSERVEEAVAALDGLRDKGLLVTVPLVGDGATQITLGMQVALPSRRPIPKASLNLLRNVSMEVTVEIGRTRMTVDQLLALHANEVVELDRAASSPADLMVNGTLLAHGEIVVIDEVFGLRITEIVTDPTTTL